jgi:hypothetical protein
MNHLTVAQALARANASMVEADTDVAGALVSLLVTATHEVQADAAAVLVECDGSMDVLAATSHRVADLEAYQAQVDEGPCVDAIRSGAVVDVAGAEAVVARWPLCGPAMLRAGYTAVHATPLTWHGVTFGGLNVFRSEAASFGPREMECRALADAATLVIVSRNIGPDVMLDGLRQVLEERAVVEQAKGALAHVNSLDMAQAYEALLARSESEGSTLGVTARRVLDLARRGALGQSSTST